MARSATESVVVAVCLAQLMGCGRIGIESIGFGELGPADAGAPATDPTSGGGQDSVGGRADSAGSAGSAGAATTGGVTWGISGAAGTAPVNGGGAAGVSVGGSEPGGAAGAVGVGGTVSGGGLAGDGGSMGLAGSVGAGGSPSSGGAAGTGGAAAIGGAAGSAGVAGSGGVLGIGGATDGGAGAGGAAGTVANGGTVASGGAGGTGGSTITIGSITCAPYWPAEPPGPVYRVAPGGDDGNDCTDGNPCQTLQRASDVVSTPGSLVLVDDGTYDGFYAAHPDVWFRANGDNVVINTSQDGPYGVTGDNINIEGVDGVVIEGFVVRDATRNGIRIVDSSNVVIIGNRVGPNDRGIFTGFAPGIRILNNEAFDSTGGSGISHTNSNTPNDDFVICGNVTHHNDSGINVDADCNAGGDGMLEDGVVAANVVYQNQAKGIGLAATPGVLVFNNILYENGLSGGAGSIHLCNSVGCDAALASSNAVVMNNTAYEPHVVALRITSAAHDVLVFNNIFTGRSDAVTDEVGTSTIDGSNIIQELVTGLSFTADYRLQPGSIAIDAGVATLSGFDAPTQDIDGTVRPQGSGVDVGACELP